MSHTLFYPFIQTTEQKRTECESTQKNREIQTLNKARIVPVSVRVASSYGSEFTICFLGLTMLNVSTREGGRERDNMLCGVF